ncbi:hypothetical protein ACVW1A_006964 [Bradyrhizobium sp. LB1.3]
MSDGTRVDRTKYLYAKTVKGRPYLYFRMRDGQLVPLPLDRDSGEFRRAYDSCRKTRDKAAEQTSKAEPVQPPTMKQVAFIGGTVGKAIERFKGSPEYMNDLRPSSRYIYDRAFDIMRDKIGVTLLSDFADVDVVDVYSAGISVPRWVKREVRGTMKKVRQGGPASADPAHHPALDDLAGMPQVSGVRHQEHPKPVHRCRAPLYQAAPSGHAMER